MCLSFRQDLTGDVATPMPRRRRGSIPSSPRMLGLKPWRADRRGPVQHAASLACPGAWLGPTRGCAVWAADGNGVRQPPPSAGAGCAGRPAAGPATAAPWRSRPPGGPARGPPSAPRTRGIAPGIPRHPPASPGPPATDCPWLSNPPTRGGTREAPGRQPYRPACRGPVEPVLLGHPPHWNTTVRFPCRRMRSSRCQATARASTARSISRPTRRMSATLSRCVTRCTSCSMIGPASRSAVT